LVALSYFATYPALELNSVCVWGGRRGQDGRTKEEREERESKGGEALRRTIKTRAIK